MTQRKKDEGEVPQGEHDHADGRNDPHVWMDPENAKVIARALAKTLGDIDTQNAARYHANAESFAGDVDRLSADMADEVKLVRDKRYIVFHDAYQYFEKRFGLSAGRQHHGQSGSDARRQAHQGDP